MISLVNCNQQNSSRCACEGWSWPGGGKYAHLPRLHVSRQRAFETIRIATLLHSGKLLFASDKVERGRKPWCGHKEKPESCIQRAQKHPNPG